MLGLAPTKREGVLALWSDGEWRYQDEVGEQEWLAALARCVRSMSVELGRERRKKAKLKKKLKIIQRTLKAAASHE